MMPRSSGRAGVRRNWLNTIFARVKFCVMKKLVFVSLFLTGAVQAAYSQLPPKNIKALAFIAGKWETTTSWGDMEEYWSEPMGDCMMCVYRCVKDGKVVFYEMIVIEQTDSGPVMKLRHFNPGLIAWEDKEKPYEYRLMFLEADKARFERPDKKTYITFHRTSPKTLKVILESQDKEGQWIEDVFDYKLAE